MRRHALFVIFQFQKLFLLTFALLYSLFRGRRRPRNPEWVVGVIEVAAHLKYIGDAVASPAQVCLEPNRYYDFTYDFRTPGSNLRLISILKLIHGPLLLAYLCLRYENFFYIAQRGFLLEHFDGRDFEFAMLKKMNKRIVCSFMGSEIRSFKLMRELGERLGLETVITYQTLAASGIDSPAAEELRRNLAAAADRHAALIFNYPVEQISYIQRKVNPFIYFYPDERFQRNDQKFAGDRTLKIVHAPSSPLIKGTPLVRAAIKKLRTDGFKFEYVELIGMPNRKVLEELATAQIVLNEFYTFVPGLFGVEAMAAHCALLTSADEQIETSLPPGSNEAWMVTKYYEIYDNLRRLLESPALIKQYADAGHAWALEHAAARSSGKKLVALLDTVP